MKKDKSLKFNVEVVKGQCPTCTEHTMLVNIDKEYYRCITWYNPDGISYVDINHTHRTSINSNHDPV